MKRMIILMTAWVALVAAAATAQLQFDPTCAKAGQLVLPDGTTVNYTAYERLYYVTNVEDSVYQYLNVYVPQGANEQSPIFLRTYVGGYMASAATQPQAGDATGKALKEGFVVVIPGSRGRNAMVTATRNDKKKGVKKGQTVYTGRAPAAILDLKAAIRYLRLFDAQLPGNPERIITDGTSAGGAMSALMGATGNNPAYESMLEEMGAAKGRDDVFASVCYCPITDLKHADMAYEWLYNGTDSRQHGDSQVLAVSNELRSQFPTYINSLNLKAPDGTPLNANNYLDYIKRELIRSAQIAKNAGAELPDSIGLMFSEGKGFGTPPIDGGRPFIGMPNPNRHPNRNGGPHGGRGAENGEYIVDLDMPKYLNYVVLTQPLKTAPAFDTKGVLGQAASGENEEFGDAKGSSTNFTAYGALKAGTTLAAGVSMNEVLLNPMNFIGDPSTAVAPHWYIRHGARDRDTAFPIPVNLALKLMNAGKDVNFLLAWNRPHSGDYALDELFAWIHSILNE